MQTQSYLVGLLRTNITNIIIKSIQKQSNCKNVCLVKNTEVGGGQVMPTMIQAAIKHNY